MKKLKSLFGSQPDMGKVSPKLQSAGDLKSPQQTNAPSSQAVNSHERNPSGLSLPDSTAFKASVRSEEDPSINPFKKSNYIFVKRLGSGSYAEVKEAIHLPTKQHVAIKIIDKHHMRNREDRVRNEIEILRTVGHRNLLKLIDWGFGKQNIYLVTEM
jgi:hypothetical protein